MGNAERSREMLPRVAAALAEAGYPDADLYVNARGFLTHRSPVPLPTLWRAGALAISGRRRIFPCFPCWKAANYTGPVDDPCTHDLWDGAPPIVRPARG